MLRRAQVQSDDGSKVYIDHKLIINADGAGWLSGAGTVKLAAGVHHIRVSYFQGPRYHLYLMLSVAGPHDKGFHPFRGYVVGEEGERVPAPASPALALTFSFYSPELH